MARVESILADALELPEEDRADVARQIIETLGAPDPHADLTDEQFEAELSRRIADVDEGRIPTLDLKTIRKRVFGGRKR